MWLYFDFQTSLLIIGCLVHKLDFILTEVVGTVDIYAGSSLARVQWVHLHPRFLRNLVIIHIICTHRSTCKQILGI